jgi:hypothetical protein
MSDLAGSWQEILAAVPDGALLDTCIDPAGILIL